MMKNVLRRFLSLALSIFIVLGIVPILEAPVWATGVANWSSSQIGLDYSGGSWSYENDTLTGSIEGNNNGTCSSALSATTTLTIKNNTGAVGNLKFNYSITGSGSITINGVAATGTSYVEQVAIGGEVKVEITSPAGKGNKETCTITGLEIEALSQKNITFLAGHNGTYTVGGAAVEAGTVSAVSMTDGCALSASTTVTGATFMGWVDGDGLIVSKEQSFTFKPTKDTSIRPVFAVSGSTGWYLAGGTHLFDDLNAANAYALTATSKTIVPVNNATLPAGDYTISSGVTLLIPFDDAHTIYTTAPALVEGGGWTSDSNAYRVLTMANGANITVNGAISVSAKQGTNTSCVTGAYGKIVMNSGSTITVNDDAFLYVWGFITGDGAITVESGGTVYESFQFTSWRGGQCTLSMKSNESKYRVFPLTQYYVQNIHTPMTLKAGAIEYAYASATFLGSSTGAGVPFVGTSGSMFIINNGHVIKKYDASRDRQVIEVHGEVSLSPTSVKLYATLETKNYDLPLTNNMTVDVISGTATINQNLAILPGAEVFIREGAKCVLGSGVSAYVYDRDQWDRTGQAIGYAGNFAGNFAALGYVPGRSYIRTDKDDIIDAFVLVDGTLDASAGYLYTTSGGANIHSTKQGTVILNAAASNAATYQAVQNNTSVGEWVSIPITSAELKNSDNTYTSTAGTTTATTYKYLEGFWHKDATHRDATDDNNHTCDVCGKAGISVCDANIPLEAVEATCTSTGLTAGTKCSECDAVQTPQTSTEKNPNKHTGTEAWTTTETQHTKAYSCCGAVTVTTEAHEWSEGVCSECNYSCLHADANKDHICDYGCGVYQGVHADSATDDNHVCDHGCGEVLENHTEVIDAAAAATCTTTGLTEGKHCKTCGEVIVKQEVVPVLGHSYRYKDNGDGTHTYTCAPCGGNGSEAHSYKNGLCVCGAQEPLEIYGASVNLGNELSMKFFVKKSAVDNFYSGDQLFIRVTKEYADGRENVVEETYLSDWSNYNSSFYCVTFSDISAKEMTDMLHVQIFYAAAEGEEAVAASPVWDDSMRNYSMRGLTNGTFDDLVCRLVVDMLNYGAAAQEEFGYGVDDLATSELTDKQKAMATQEAITCTDGRTKSDNCVGSNLNLGSALTMSVFFREITTDMRAEITYTNYKDVEKTATVDGSNFVLYGTDMYRIYVNETVVADVNQLVTVSVYDGDECVAWCTDSIESNIARGEADKPVYEMIMKFAASAKQYFLNRGY